MLLGHHRETFLEFRFQKQFAVRMCFTSQSAVVHEFFFRTETAIGNHLSDFCQFCVPVLMENLKITLKKMYIMAEFLTKTCMFEAAG